MRARATSSAVWLALAASIGGACGARPEAREAAWPETGPRSLVASPPIHARLSIDLGDDEAAAAFSTSWRVIDVSIDEVEGVVLGDDGRPVASESARTHAIHPRPRAPGWDEAAWDAIAPHELGARRGHGQLAMGWSRASLRIPEAVGAVSLAHARLELSLTVDDYAEVWVDGQLRPRAGQIGRGVIGGWNAPVRVLLTPDAQPGTTLDVAILAINGPLSRGPENFHFVREAVLDVYEPEPAGPRGEPVVRERITPALDAIVSAEARLEVVAVGFEELGSMVWDEAARGLLLAAVGADTIHRFDPADGSLTLVRAHAGDVRGGREHVGPSGLAIDAAGRLVVCERGRARVTRTESTLALTELLAPREGSVPEDALVAPDDAVWLVAEEVGGAALLRVGPDGTRELATPSDRAGDLALSADGTRVLATLGGGTRIVSYALTGDDARPFLEVPREDAPIRDLFALEGAVLLAAERGLLVTNVAGVVLGRVGTSTPALALAATPDGVLYVSTGRTLLRVVPP